VNDRVQRAADRRPQRTISLAHSRGARGRTEELEILAVEMYARGLSTRDIEAVFADTDGRSLLSRSAVSEVTERLWAEYEAFASRDLTEFEVTYLFVDGPVCRRACLSTGLFVDGIAERLHPGQPRDVNAGSILTPSVFACPETRSRRLVQVVHRRDPRAAQRPPRVWRSGAREVPVHPPRLSCCVPRV
jgi:Transposase, Mutator family